jgi:ParB family chromosome partitioning protein
MSGATVSSASIARDTFQSVLLASLKLSKTNPRKHIDPKKQADLVASVKTKGVIVPILVRPLPDKQQYEVVAGERRCRAAMEAKLSEVPCQIRRMTDEEALEVQVIENDQRVDVHPLEQAEGYLQLQKKNCLTIEQIAAKVGKSKDYIEQRIGLSKLIPAAKEAFLADAIGVGHAQLIAPFSPEQQARIMKEVYRSQWIEADEDLPGKALLGERYEEKRIKVTVSVKQLEAWIHANLLLDLASAPFSPKDEKLLPKAGACTTCPKRTGNQAALFPELKKTDVCTDSSCFKAKFEAHFAKQEQEHAKNGKPLVRISRDYYSDEKGVVSKGDYRSATVAEVKAGKSQKAIVVAGGDRGHVVDVVIAKKAERSASDGSADRYARAARAKARRTKKEIYRRQLLMGALIKKITKPLSTEELRLVVRKMFGRIGAESQIMFMRSLGHDRVGQMMHQEKPFEAKVLSKAKTDLELQGLMLCVALSGELHPDHYGEGGGANLMAAVKRYRVDTRKIAAEVALKFPTPKPAKKSKPSKPAGKKKGGKG